jgi:hypothetical protein
MSIYGYARVSTDGQTLEAQVKELRTAGAERIFREKVSGAVTNRSQLQRALASRSKDDVLIVTRLDRLARSTRDLLNILADIADRGAGFRSLRDAAHLLRNSLRRIVPHVRIAARCKDAAMPQHGADQVQRRASGDGYASVRVAKVMDADVGDSRGDADALPCRLQSDQV